MSTQKPFAPASAQGEDTAREATHLRQEIAHTRAEMGNTMEQLHAKLNPTVLKDQAIESLSEIKEHLKLELAEAKDSLKAEVKAEISEAKVAFREATVGKVEHIMSDAQTTVKRTSRSFVDTVIENPVPAALAGIGLTWLLFSARNRSSYKQLGQVPPGSVAGTKQYLNQGYDMAREGAGTAARTVQSKAADLAHRAGDAARDAASNAGTKVSGLAHQASDKVTHLAHDASEKVSGLAHQASDRASHLAHDAQDFAKHTAEDVGRRGKQVGTAVSDQFDKNPLVIGAAMVAVGTAVGMAIPISRKEERLMGAVRDQVVHKAEELAHDKVAQVSDFAQKALTDGKSKLEGAIKHTTF